MTKELELPELPMCWSGSPVTVTWAEDGETTTREVYTADQMRAYALATLAKTQEGEDLARDAARYRWLRDNDWTAAGIIKHGYDYTEHPTDAFLDSAIDDYLTAQQKAPEGDSESVDEVYSISELPEFGDYVEIEQLRFGVPNEMYCYKVIGTLRSNHWRDVPAKSGQVGCLHDSVEPVVAVIQCGIAEDTVERFRLADVKITSRRFPEAALAAPRQEGGGQSEEDAHVIMTLGRLLAEIAVILKGPEPAGTAWSYHDLPEMVLAVVQESKDVADEMQAWANVKMTERGSSRRDKLMVAAWSKRLSGAASVDHQIGEESP
jgi:hypothetical protein